MIAERGRIWRGGREQREVRRALSLRRGMYRWRARESSFVLEAGDGNGRGLEDGEVR